MSDRPLHSAVILAVGSELTGGSTRDTNSGELAAALSEKGVEVLWTQALPDDLERVSAAFRLALAESDLVVSTGGLGPTPDDLTREAIAAATGLQPTVDPALERWLRAHFSRRGIEMPQSNLKQAWLLPGATALSNGNGSAPGWWLERADGRVVVALPGPPREMRPMWQSEVEPRLLERGLGRELAHATLRLTGIGESALADLIGEELRRDRDPEVATYARADAVDLRISSRGQGAAERVAAMVARLEPRLEAYVFAHGEEGWPETIGRLLAGRTLATVEAGTGGQLVALLGEADYLVSGQLRPTDGALVGALAEQARATAGADIGLALVASDSGPDTRAQVAVATEHGTESSERAVLLAGAEGHRRAALAACAELWRRLRAGTRGADLPS